MASASSAALRAAWGRGSTHKSPGTRQSRAPKGTKPRAPVAHRVTSDLRARCLATFNAVKLDRALGLDINLTSTGWALIDNTGRHLSSGTIDLSKTPDLYDKAAVLEERVFALLAEVREQDKAIKMAVGVEDFVRAFGGMSWRTVDIMRLAQLNSILSYSLYKRTGERPTKFYPASYRSHFALKKHGKEDIKKVSFAYVSSLLPDYPWTKARTGVLHKSNYDIVDAFLCAQFTLKRYREERLMSDAALKDEFTKEVMVKHASLAAQGGDKWDEKLKAAWAREVRIVSDLVFPKRGKGVSDPEDEDESG